MFKFWRSPEFVDPEIGSFKLVGNSMWHSTSTEAGIGVTAEGSNNSPFPQALEVGRRLLREGDHVVCVAEEFLAKNSEAKAFVESGGKLKFDGFIVYASREFSVEFSLSDWPDAMITVLFRDSVPCEIQLAD